MTLPDDESTRVYPEDSTPSSGDNFANDSVSIADEVTQIASQKSSSDDDHDEATQLNTSSLTGQIEKTQQLEAITAKISITESIDKGNNNDPVDDEATRIAPQESSVDRQNSEHEDVTRLPLSPAQNHKNKSHKVFASGTKIRNRFLLEQEIGRGGMGFVFAARDLLKEEVGDQDSLIAIKLLSEDFKTHPDALRMLQQETRKTQKLAHPNVVTVYDFDRDDDTVYMTMELLNGSPLTDYIKEHELTTTDLDEVLPIISDIVHGLEYAHQQGIIHSDLKPGNIFITSQKVTKIVDFGIARALMDSGTAKKNISQTGLAAQPNGDANTTQSESENLFALTPKYASPEMFDNAPPDPRDDIYALAYITYQLLAGKHPFSGLSADKVKQQGLVPERIKSLSERQWKGLCAGMALDRSARTESAELFLAAFLPKKKEPWRWATVSVALVAASITLFFLLQPPQEASLSEQDRSTVNQQLEVAKHHMEVGNLANALESYKMILALPPYDKEPPGAGFIQHPYDHIATKELKKLLDKLQELAEQSIIQGNLNDAKAFIEAGLTVDSQHTGLLRLNNQLKSNK